MCWSPWCKWVPRAGSPTVAHKWGHRSGSSGQYSFLGLGTKCFIPSCLGTSLGMKPEYGLRPCLSSCNEISLLLKHCILAVCVYMQTAKICQILILNLELFLVSILSLFSWWQLFWIMVLKLSIQAVEGQTGFYSWKISFLPWLRQLRIGNSQNGYATSRKQMGHGYEKLTNM